MNYTKSPPKFGKKKKVELNSLFIIFVAKEGSFTIKLNKRKRISIIRKHLRLKFSVERMFTKDKDQKLHILKLIGNNFFKVANKHYSKFKKIYAVNIRSSVKKKTNSGDFKTKTYLELIF